MLFLSQLLPWYAYYCRCECRVEHVWWNGLAPPKCLSLQHGPTTWQLELAEGCMHATPVWSERGVCCSRETRRAIVHKHLTGSSWDEQHWSSNVPSVWSLSYHVIFSCCLPSLNLCVSLIPSCIYFFSIAICLISVWTARARNLSIYSDLVRRVYLYQEVGLAFIHDHWVLGIKKKEKRWCSGSGRCTVMCFDWA